MYRGASLVVGKDPERQNRRPDAQPNSLVHLYTNFGHGKKKEEVSKK